MKLEDQCVSLELSKQLKEAGVKQESLFYWAINPGNGEAQIVYHYHKTGKGMLVSAFTVAELGEMLPLNQKFPDIGKSEYGDWFVNFTRGHQDHFAKEAEARGQMLLYLINQKLIDLK